ncbi:MAG: hypothetical protein AAFU79_10000 [Myxococcota bacterium]
MTTAKRTRARKTSSASPPPANESSPPAPAGAAPKAAAKAKADKPTPKATAPKAPVPPPVPEQDASEVPDPVPYGVLSLLDVFRTALGDIRFPDVDAEVLEGSCERVREADREVRRLFEALEAAQVKLSEERSNLHRTAERGLAYAKVFAGEDEALLTRLDGVELGGPKKARGKAKPKTKAPKADARTGATTDSAPAAEGGKLSA